MSTAIAEKNILVEDDNGDWYSIPPLKKQQFEDIKERMVNAGFGCSEWDEAVSELEESFNQYRLHD